MSEKSFYRERVKYQMRYQLIALIREVGQLWGEDKDFLDEYIAERIKACKGEYKKAIECFEDLRRQAYAELGLIE
jgi:hypothetical protein